MILLLIDYLKGKLKESNIMWECSFSFRSWMPRSRKWCN